MALDDGDYLLQILDLVIQGDLSGLVSITSRDHAELRQVATTRGRPWIVSRRAVVSALDGLYAGSLSPEQAQCWASFVSHGYIENRTSGPIKPLDIDYEDAWEEAIVEAISRLDEIGDIVDGEVSMGEILDLLQLLGEQGQP